MHRKVTESLIPMMANMSTYATRVEYGFGFIHKWRAFNELTSESFELLHQFNKNMSCGIVYQ